MTKPIVYLALVGATLATANGCARQTAPAPATVTVTGQAQSSTALTTSSSSLPTVGKADACTTYKNASDIVFNAEKGFHKLTNHDGWKYADPGVLTAASDAVSGERMGANKIENAMTASAYPSEMMADLKAFVTAVRDLAQSLEEQHDSDTLRAKGHAVNEVTKKLDAYCGIE